MRSDPTMLRPLREGHPVGKASQGSFLEEAGSKWGLKEERAGRVEKGVGEVYLWQRRSCW